MTHRLVGFAVPAVVILLLVFAGPAGWAADSSTNAPSQDAPADAPPAPMVPSETPGASSSTAPAAPAAPATSSSTERPGEYTVVAGDTLWGISHKFDTSIRHLKKLNHLKKDNLKPGQVLKIPAAKSASGAAKKTTAISHRAKSITSSAAPHAEPAQEFDLAAPSSAAGQTVSPSPEKPQSPAPAFAGTGSVKHSIRTSEPTYRTPSGPIEVEEPTNVDVAETQHAAAPSPHHAVKAPLAAARPVVSTPTLVYSSPAPKPVEHSPFNFFYTPPPSVDWGARFTQVARDLGDRGLDYNDDWCPPGESHSWSMDCSNTTRYLYRAATGIQLPRTASDQYYYLHLQNKAWDVPQTANGFADSNYLRQNLRAGDLLFWENTYKPDRQPPITHVMIFLGTNERGQWTMAGSQSTRGGEHNRRHGGPDIYVFNPDRPCGGYSTWFGLVHHRGRFCAFGRPLEADKAKLAVAAND